jgi:hypothetical protein
MIDLVDAAIGAAGASLPVRRICEGETRRNKDGTYNVTLDDVRAIGLTVIADVPGEAEQIARAYLDAAALVGQQPPDVAGRIRALIQEYAGRWADAEPRSIERRAATGVMDDLCRALDDARTGTGRPLTWWIELFRHPGGSMDPMIRAHRSLAAAELEAIVRECAPTEDR